MRLLSSLLLASALSLSAGTAIAACHDDTASAAGPDMTATAGIAKDGSQAPLEGAAQPGAASDAGDNKIAKDGSTMPLAEGQGGGNKDLATSQQDVEAQQKGEKTAAAAGDAGSNMIAKDGSQAPLEGAAQPGAAGDAGDNKIAKDGSTMPLAEGQGGGNKDLATSQQDVEAQQQGEKTAAATAMDDECKE